MPRRIAPSQSGFASEWAMLVGGFIFSVVGVGLWLNAASTGWQIVGLILLVWGVGAGLRALAGFIRAGTQRQ
jgi:hypothetical protein